MIRQMLQGAKKVGSIFFRHFFLALDEAMGLGPSERPGPMKSIRLTDEILMACAKAGYEELQTLAEERNQQRPPWEALPEATRTVLVRQARRLFLHKSSLPDLKWDEAEQERFAQGAVAVADLLKREANQAEAASN